MPKTVFAAALAALALASGAATAADNLPYGAASAAGRLLWQGPYVGANLGYQWGGVSNNPANPSGVVGGVQAGYNWQYGQFVFGGETDLQVSDADDTFAVVEILQPLVRHVARARRHRDEQHAVLRNRRPRLRNLEDAEHADRRVGDRTPAPAGPAALGMEVALTGNWTRQSGISLRRSGRAARSFSTGTNHGIESNMLRFGVNYRF